MTYLKRQQFLHVQSLIPSLYPAEHLVQLMTDVKQQKPKEIFQDVCSIELPQQRSTYTPTPTKDGECQCGLIKSHRKENMYLQMV
jgi:hypothetical protein